MTRTDGIGLILVLFCVAVVFCVGMGVGALALLSVQY